MDTDIGPMELFFSWQAVLVALATVGVAEVFTRIGDRLIGKEKRQANWWLSNLAWPAIPVVCGAIVAAVVPLRPGFLEEWATAHATGLGAVLLFALWGACCGQFANTIYDKVVHPLVKR